MKQKLILKPNGKPRPESKTPDFIMGPLQDKWVDALYRHPERRMDGYLAEKEGSSRGYTACCLGELHLCAHRMNGTHPRWITDYAFNGEVKRLHDAKRGATEDQARMDENTTSFLEHSFTAYGLRDGHGSLKVKWNHPTAVFHPQGGGPVRAGFDSLADANDNEVGWVEIADYICTYPAHVFTHPV